MNKIRLEFENSNGEILAGLLELPGRADEISGFALFAHYHKKLPLEEVSIRLVHERVHAEDCIDCDGKIERLTRRISLVGDLSEDERRRLLEIADKCPLHRTLESDPQIVTELVE